MFVCLWTQTCVKRLCITKKTYQMEQGSWVFAMWTSSGLSITYWNPRKMEELGNSKQKHISYMQCPHFCSSFANWLDVLVSRSDRGAPPHPGVLGERDSGDRERLTAWKSCVILKLRLDLETTCFSGDAAFCIPSPAIVPKGPANEAFDYKHGVITIPRDPANCVVPRAKGMDEINNNGRTPLCKTPQTAGMHTHQTEEVVYSPRSILS